MARKKDERSYGGISRVIFSVRTENTWLRPTTTVNQGSVCVEEINFEPTYRMNKRGPSQGTNSPWHVAKGDVVWEGSDLLKGAGRRGHGLPCE